jgi:hypothetical protein
MTFQKTTRREALRMCGAGLAAACARRAFGLPSSTAASSDTAPALAAGAPNSPERTVLIDNFRRRSEGLQDKFEPRAYKDDWTMPYRSARRQPASCPWFFISAAAAVWATTI